MGGGCSASLLQKSFSLHSLYVSTSAASQNGISNEMQIGPLSFPPANLWPLCVLTARLAATVKAGSQGQLANPDIDKKCRKRDGAWLRRTVWTEKRSRDVWESQEILFDEDVIPPHVWETFSRVTRKSCYHLSIHFIITGVSAHLPYGRQQHTQNMRTYFSSDSDHCLPFRHSLRWRALRWDVTPGFAPSVGDSLSVTQTQLSQCLSGDLIWCCGRGASGVELFICLCVCAHLQTCHRHISLALTHVDCFTNVQFSPFPVWRLHH